MTLGETPTAHPLVLKRKPAQRLCTCNDWLGSCLSGTRRKRAAQRLRRVHQTAQAAGHQGRAGVQTMPQTRTNVAKSAQSRPATPSPVPLTSPAPLPHFSNAAPWLRDPRHGLDTAIRSPTCPTACFVFPSVNHPAGPTPGRKTTSARPPSCSFRPPPPAPCAPPPLAPLFTRPCPGAPGVPSYT